MMRAILAVWILVTTLCADVNISAVAGVSYTINGLESSDKSAKEGAVIEYKSGSGKLALKDDVSNKKIILSKPGDKYTAAQTAGLFSGVKAYFAKVDVEEKGAFTRGDGDCKQINLKKDALPLTPAIKTIRYYQNDELIEEYGIGEDNITAKKGMQIKPTNGDLIRMIDESGYDIYCLKVKI